MYDPEELHNHFEEEVELCAEGFFGHADILWRLSGELWNCKDVMRGDTCRALEMRTGSTYAQGARELRRFLRSKPFASGCGLTVTSQWRTSR
jgi:hypothetical protein